MQFVSFGFGRSAQAIDKVVLQVGEYRGADFNQLLAAVARHNLGIWEGHKIKDGNRIASTFAAAGAMSAPSASTLSLSTA